MSTDSGKMDTGQENSDDESSALVAVYRFVIVDGEACRDDNLRNGIWIWKDSKQKETAYTAHVARKDWTVSLVCLYTNAGVITAVKMLDLNDELKSVIGWESGAEEGQDAESGQSQEASGVPDAQNVEVGDESDWTMVLDNPSNRQVGTKDDNGNHLLRLELFHYPQGMNGAHRQEMALWWAKKAVSDIPETVLSRAELERFRNEGKFGQKAQKVQTEKFDVGRLVKALNSSRSTVAS